MEIETAPDRGGNPGLPYIAACAALVAFCVLYDFPGGDRQRGLAAAVSWMVAAAMLAVQKLSLAPSATYVLAMETVVLSTVALGSLLQSFPAFIVTSTVATGAQAFLSLPMKIKS